MELFLTDLHRLPFIPWTHRHCTTSSVLLFLLLLLDVHIFVFSYRGKKNLHPFLSRLIGHGVCIYKFILSGHLNEAWLWYGLAKKLDTALKHTHTCQDLDL